MGTTAKDSEHRAMPGRISRSDLLLGSGNKYSTIAVSPGPCRRLVMASWRARLANLNAGLSVAGVQNPVLGRPCLGSFWALVRLHCYLVCCSGRWRCSSRDFRATIPGTFRVGEASRSAAEGLIISPGSIIRRKSYLFSVTRLLAMPPYVCAGSEGMIFE